MDSREKCRYSQTSLWSIAASLLAALLLTYDSIVIVTAGFTAALTGAWLAVVGCRRSGSLLCSISAVLSLFILLQLAVAILFLIAVDP